MQQPTILVLGLKPERLVDSEGRIDAFLEPPTQEQGETLVEAVRSGAEAGGHVLAIVPQWLKGDGLLRLQMVESALDDERLTIHETPLPPLAASVLASLASAVAPHLPSRGVLVSLLGELEAELHVFTWLGSVSGLSVPAPTIGQHVASLSPGSAFGVSSYPEPSVHKLGRDGAGVPLPRIERPSRLAVSDHGGNVALGAHRQRGARRPRGAGGRADAQRAVVVGHRQAGRERRLPGRRAAARRRARAGRRPVDVPLVPRADRPLAVPDVRASRPARRAAAPPPPLRGFPGRSARRPHVAGRGGRRLRASSSTRARSK